ncbi:tRNA (adenosine(37)-N6)-threonylcarbamoyltransferase complex dimerization subunit type 1 TsaB [uncultured Gemmiger sp.]|uniref:tRNA (adenosine(37)-N6)-threonylcarbamoyltransferase complex dimerization subunit type 1 TsaB n=1 Tax=uncultured Gemmiger sp. TaxID=1623490 RepID=UPI0025FF1A2D|nr:tRNA (adenosine(37)-N6)-threonylcarbamoyltransferase complex dimerization subunit type 1 TsaB [uncultured Gemmiger sp.]
MNILAIDTAGRSASVALLQDDTLLYETVCNCGLTHSETLMPMVDAALKTGGIRPADLDLFAVTAGPGSFTGLRIGLAAVKGMALPANTPCAGVSTLEAQAWCHTGSGTVIAAMDARRGQVYWAAFDLTTHARLTPDAAAPAEEAVAFARSCKKPVIYIGDGAALCYNKDEQALPCPPALRVARAVGAGLAGRALWAAGGCVPPAGLMPNYLRLSQAERERAAREAAAKESETVKS